MVSGSYVYLALILVLYQVGIFVAKLLDSNLHDAPILVIDVIVRAPIG